MKRIFFTFVCWFIPIKRIRSRLKAKYIKAHPIHHSSCSCVILHIVSREIVKRDVSWSGGIISK